MIKNLDTVVNLSLTDVGAREKPRWKVPPSCYPPILWIKKPVNYKVTYRGWGMNGMAGFYPAVRLFVLYISLKAANS